MQQADDKMDFSPTPVSVCCVILTVEAVGATVAIGLYTIISNAGGMMGTDILLGSVVLLMVTFGAFFGMAKWARKRRKTIFMQEDRVSMRTYSGVDEVVRYEQIEAVKNREDSLFIHMKDGRIIALLPVDFKSRDMQSLFAEELENRMRKTSGSGGNLARDAKSAA